MQLHRYQTNSKIPFDKIFIIAVIIFLSTGCTHTIHIKLDNTRQKMVIEEQSDRRSARLFVSEKRIKIDSLQIVNETIRYYPKSEKGVQKVHVDSIQKFQYKNHLNGAFEGVGFGFMLAGVVGSIHESITGNNEWFGPFMVGILTGTAGGIVGLPVGAAIGSKYIYLAPKDNSNQKK